MADLGDDDNCSQNEITKYFENECYEISIPSEADYQNYLNDKYKNITNISELNNKYISQCIYN